VAEAGDPGDAGDAGDLASGQPTGQFCGEYRGLGLRTATATATRSWHAGSGQRGKASAPYAVITP
jgi:hypothetical protein